MYINLPSRTDGEVRSSHNSSRVRGLIKFRQQYIYVSDQDIERLRITFESNRLMTATQMLQAVLTESYDRAPIILSEEVRQLIRQFTEQTDIPIPEGILATLRPLSGTWILLDVPQLPHRIRKHHCRRHGTWKDATSHHALTEDEG